MNLNTPINVAILGATGIVGQKVISLLQKKSSFKIAELVASEQRIGCVFKDVCDWKERGLRIPDDVANIELTGVGDIKSEFVISCLPSEIAEKSEPFLLQKGKIIFSNASFFRMHKNVPLLVPEINSRHLSLLEKQETIGKIVTNPNCSAVGITLGLAPLIEVGLIEHVSIATLQSVSGAGYPGIASIDILGNTIPHIEGEAEKISEETKKILGSVDASADFAVTVTVHRVPVLFGHTATVHIFFKDNVDVEDVFAKYAEWNRRYPNLFVIHTKKGRPQSAKDLKDDDMSIHIGHLMHGDRKNVLKMVLLSHNLIRGAAGAVIANMEAYLRYFG